MMDEKALNKLLALVQRLHARTCERKIDWTETPNESRFVAQLDRFTLALKKIPDPNYPDQPDFELVVFDQTTDRKVERITNGMLRPVMDRVTDEGLNPYKLLYRTFEMARRQVLGSDDALEAILKSLAEE